MEKSAPESWSEMWTRPTLTSFSTSFQNNYDGPILEFWQSQITGDLKHVVDLACGNGALTWIANDLLNKDTNKTKVTGIDYADINPFEILNKNPDDFPEVSFISKTGIENMPFSDGSIDLIISQYGLEYSNLDQSIPEISRVLSPAGRMAFITHDIDGVIGQSAVSAFEDSRMISKIIRCDELIIRLAQLRETLGKTARTADTEAYQELMAKIKANMNIIYSLIAKSPRDVSLNTYRMTLDSSFQEAQKPPEKRQFDVEATLNINHTKFEESIERRADLINACMNKKERKNLLKLIKKAGFQVTENRILEQKAGENWGTIFAAKRASAPSSTMALLKKLLPG